MAAHNQNRKWVDPAKGDQTFQAVATKWLANYRTKSGKARGTSQHAQIINGKKSHVRTHFGHRRVGDISNADIEAWVKALSAKRSQSTVRHNFYTLRKVLRYAHRNGLILTDPTEGIEMEEQDSVHVQQSNLTLPSSLQVNAMIDALPEPWDMYVWLAAETGMRPEELCALQVRDVQEDATLIHVRRVRVKAEDNKTWIYEDRPKTKAGNRLIDLDDDTAQALGAHIRRHQACADRWFKTHPEHQHPGDQLPLFPGNVDMRGRHGQSPLPDFSTPLRHGWFMRHYWPAAREAANLADGARFYDLRHYHASWLVENSDYNIEEIAKRLGHASTKMTLDRYVHADRDSTRRKRGSLGSRRRLADNVRRLPA